MNALTITAPARRARALGIALALLLVALIAALAGPGTAGAACENPRTAKDIVSCYVPIQGQFTFNVPLDAATQSATGIPGDAGASGTSNITLDADTNMACATTSWSGVHSPVVAAHIHGGAYGKPEDPAVTISLFDPDFVNGRTSPASGCSLVPPGEIGVIAKCPAQFDVVVHSQLAAWGAIRGQVGTTCSL